MRVVDRESIAAVVQACPIGDIAAEYGVELVPLGPRLGIARCVLHQDAVGRSLLIEHDTGRFRCLTCQMGGDVVGLVMMLDHLGFLAALARLAARAGLDFDSLFPERVARADVAPPPTTQRQVRRCEVPLWALTPPPSLGALR